MSVSGAYDDGFDEPVRESALICWPVEFLSIEEDKPTVTGLHCTVAYWPEVKLTQQEMLDTIVNNNKWQIKYFRQWRIVDIKGVGAFGELNDYPVLLVNNDQYNTTLTEMHNRVKGAFSYANGPDRRFTYTPHISVDLKTIVNPPKQVVFRPMELWYKDEKPVIV